MARLGGRVSAAGHKTQRIQNTTSATDVGGANAGPTVLQGLVIRNITSAATVTVADSATTKVVVDAPVGTVTIPFFGAMFPTKLTITPSATTVDCLVVYDGP